MGAQRMMQLRCRAELASLSCLILASSTFLGGCVRSPGAAPSNAGVAREVAPPSPVPPSPAPPSALAGQTVAETAAASPPPPVAEPQKQPTAIPSAAAESSGPRAAAVAVAPATAAAPVAAAAPANAAEPAGAAGPATAGEPAASTEPSAVAASQAGAGAGGDDHGRRLYLQHCAACHGDNGNGRGIVAVFLNPKPRNFRSLRFRLISTTNGVPTVEDLNDVLVRGMPGSSMPSWAHLSAADRQALIGEVQRQMKDGIREEYVRVLKEQQGLEDDEIDPDEVADVVASRTTPAERREVPVIGEPDAAAIARGKELYIKQSCHSCHGNEGKGDGVQKMVDEDGLATRPRDFTRGIFKGGHDPVSLFRRLALGMPGTPMPASPQLTAEQIVDIVHFMRSTSTEEVRLAAILRRESLMAKRVARLDDKVDAPLWNSNPPVEVRMMPTWWRDDAPFRVQVQAVHDGRDVAVRLSWEDATQNGRAVGPDEFEDMAAVEFYQGQAEPFLGMGALGTQLDLWQWRAGLAQTGSEDWKSDEYPFDTPLYKELAKGQELPDFLTARAAGNPLAARETSGASLTAAGPGSLTFRPRASQLVKAAAQWQNGRWVVVLSRPLAVSGDDGLPLVAGNRYSLAVAVWDGAAHDRAGQKLISLWNDLQME